MPPEENQPAPDAAPENALVVPPETPAPEIPTEAEGAPPEAAAEAPATPEPAPKKSPVARLQGRVGHLTKTLHERETELQTLRQQNETMQALLGGRQAAPADPVQPVPNAAPAAPPPPLPRTQAEFDQAVREQAIRVAADTAFQTEADKVNAQGKQKLGATWDDSLAALTAMGILQRGFVEAAFATDDPVSVLNTLGQDLDEAARIASLPPIRMAVELAKMANKPAATPSRPAVSGAPPPIKPVGGAVKPEIDIADPNLPMAEYVARRKAMGSPFAR